MGNYRPKTQQEKDFDEYQLGRQGIQTGSMHNQDGLHHQAGKNSTGNGNKGGCFPGDAKVLTPYGLRMISTIKTNDEVMAFSKNGLIQTRRVKSQKQHGQRLVHTISLSNGLSVRATATHTIHTGKGWRRIDNIKIADEIFTYEMNGCLTASTVMKIENNVEIQPVFNLIVEEDYSFITESCIAHSFTYFKNLRTFIGQLGDSVRRYGLGDNSSDTAESFGGLSSGQT